MTPAASVRSPGSAALVVVALVTAVTVAATAVATATTATAAANPVISSVAPDPSVQRGADGAFHVHATSDDWGDGA
ncbi:glycosyl hydrolase family 43, partial [Dietzia sp. E1]|nr:glycosyl hydrolase family 43 [Dietzia sp. E1]